MQSRTLFGLLLVVFQLFCISYVFAQVHAVDSTVMEIYRVQVGSYTVEYQAQDMVVKAQRDGLEPVRIDIISSLYKVRVGQYADYTTAKQVATELGTRGYPGSFVVLIRLTRAEAIGLGLIPELSLYDEATSNVNLGSPRTEQELLAEATTANDLTIAIQDYIELIVRFPQSAYVPMAKYLTGYYYYRIAQDRNLALNTAADDTSRRYFESAVQVFRETLTQYPDDEFAPPAQFWLAMTQYKLSRYGGDLATKMANAAEAFKQVVTNYPDSSIAADAQMQYGGLLQELARNQRASYDQARAELTKVETLYPDA